MDLTWHELILIIGIIIILVMVIDNVRSSSSKYKFKLKPDDNKNKQQDKHKNNTHESMPKRVSPVIHDDINNDLNLDLDVPNITAKVFKQPEKVITVYVHAQEGDEFSGATLFNKLLEHGMRFGEMDIFHRYANGNKILFSMANGVNPPNFDIDNFEHFTTPALSFFIVLPCPNDPLKALTLMLEVAYKLAKDLDGVVKDDNLCLLNKQTFDHYKQIINDFKRNQLLQDRV